MRLQSQLLSITCLALGITSCAKLTRQAEQYSHKQVQLTEPNSPIKIPGSWQAAAKGSHNEISTGWLDEFNSPALTKLVLEAVNNNPNLNAAAANLRAARLNTVGSRAALLPSVTASSSASRSRSANGSSPSTLNTSLGLNLNTSWEPDIWNQLRDLRQADLAGFEASIEDFRAARLSLAANTASAYCDLITAQKLVDLARKTLQSFKKNRDIVERNYKAGIPGTRAIAVQLSRTNVSSAQGNLESQILQRDNARRDLEALLGRYPSAQISAAKSLPKLKPNLPLSIPSTLLNRRPDLVAAQLDIYVSAKQADATAKNLLPSFNLSSAASTAGSDLRDLIDPQQIAINIAASLAQTIYRGGELQANTQAALEQNKAAIYAYADAAIDAFQEVEDAIDASRSLQAQEEALIKEIKQAAFAEKSAELDYSEGIENSGILEILESQRRATDAREALINIKNSRLQNRIGLHLALGGDFHTESKK